MDLTLLQLSSATGSGVVHAQDWLPHIQATLDAYDLNTLDRAAMFLAQIGHESGGLRFTSELWGPTPAQVGYEGRADLGNTQPGDGQRFKGHGLIQITGRRNHADMRDFLRARFSDVPDFEADPEALTIPRWAALSAGQYWYSRGLNAAADAGDFERITRRINGGLNGYADRLKRLEIARGVLS